MLLLYWGIVVQYLLLLRVHESLLPPQTKISRWNPDITYGHHSLLHTGNMNDIIYECSTIIAGNFRGFKISWIKVSTIINFKIFVSKFL